MRTRLTSERGRVSPRHGIRRSEGEGKGGGGKGSATPSGKCARTGVHHHRAHAHRPPGNLGESGTGLHSPYHNHHPHRIVATSALCSPAMAATTAVAHHAPAGTSAPLSNQGVAAPALGIQSFYNSKIQSYVSKRRKGGRKGKREGRRGGRRARALWALGPHHGYPLLT